MTDACEAAAETVGSEHAAPIASRSIGLRRRMFANLAGPLTGGEAQVD
jgi:hypothetical protein